VRSLVFDGSALVALFVGHERVSALWFAAEEAGVPVVLPAASIALANRQLKASDNAWSALLFGNNVHALDLSLASALSASRESGDLDVAHACVEARAAAAAVVTAIPDAYDPRVRAITFSPA
jgi:hypothetical protein